MLFKTKFAFHTCSAESLTIREGLFSDPFRPMISDSHHFLSIYRRHTVFSFQNHIRRTKEKTLNSIPALSGQSESVYMYATFPSQHGSQHQWRKADTAEAPSQLRKSNRKALTEKEKHMQLKHLHLWRSKRLEHFVCKLCRVEEKEILQNLLWLDKLLQQLRQLKQANMI